ncbi:spore photoproduct lyase [Ammoniphilus oxalaticus]|uniref:Spore photoproduct lyase n=1 Tax=Ammoniphilus oxalaticus TaxID=66863 RepID=A0A419SMN8_9BACL|nr:spore photoproduct lyase [Ammoniphilus oxalaticus]RKD25557.1 spore photoproduct lyase [Ammoniphilus oxalaticus]
MSIVLDREKRQIHAPLFKPDVVFFEPQALEYPLGKQLWEHYQQQSDTPVRMTTSHNQVRGIEGDSGSPEWYRNAKRTLVIGVKRSLKFETSKPSAEYAIPLATGCMGHCHYCYLNTNVGTRPYIRIYVNLDEIFAQASKYMNERAPEITRFEAACTSDPVGIEHISGSLKKTIEFFGQQELGHLRFVTKFAHVDPLLDAKHNGRTRFRFSVNADYVVDQFEPGTSPLQDRIEAARKVAEAGYPLGFLCAPLYRFDGWQEGYERLFQKLSAALPPASVTDLTFELIQHRFTKVARNLILTRYPKTKLEMDETKRQYKWGKYGRGKYVYKKDEALELHQHLKRLINEYFPQAEIAYFT